jgi:hypothetical protein
MYNYNFLIDWKQRVTPRFQSLIIINYNYELQLTKFGS